MRTGLKPETVVEAAAAIANRDGLEAVTLASLAAALGIKPPSLYNHVAGFDDLRRKLGLLGTQKLLHRLKDAAVGRSGEAAMQDLGKAYVDFVREQPGLYDAMSRCNDPSDSEYAAAAGDILNLLVRLLAPYRLGETEMVHAVRGLRSLLHGFASLEASGGFRMPEDRNDSMIWALRTYLKGLRP